MEPQYIDQFRVILKPTVAELMAAVNEAYLKQGGWLQQILPMEAGQYAAVMRFFVERQEK